MNITYYLPELLLGGAVAAFLIWGIFFARDMFRYSRGGATCMHCQSVASKVTTPAYLFLLPVSFGAKYEDAQNYLLSHMKPILGKEEIPSGRRACHVEVYQCGKCGKKQVQVTDFLQVRGEESLEGTYIFPFEPFQQLLSRWEILGGRPRDDR